jgi:uncharacterized protein YigA (DUF484 family)
MDEQDRGAPATAPWRAAVMAAPDALLDDPEVMAALCAAHDARMGGNVVDLRGMALARLEARHARLEATHREVIAAAYDNLAGASQVHRAILALMAAPGRDALLDAVARTLPEMLRIATAHVVIEGGGGHPAIRTAAAGTVDAELGGAEGEAASRVRLRLRDGAATGEALHGPRAGELRSEAVLRLDLGPGAPPALLALGAADEDRFRPGQGTDLLAFLGAALAVLLRRHLARPAAAAPMAEAR